MRIKMLKMLKMMLKMVLKMILKMMARRKKRSKELDRTPRGGGPVGVRLERTTRKNNPKPVGEREVDHEVEVAEDEETTIEADGAEVLIKNTNTISSDRVLAHRETCHGATRATNKDTLIQNRSVAAMAARVPVMMASEAGAGGTRERRLSLPPRKMGILERTSRG